VTAKRATLLAGCLVLGVTGGVLWRSRLVQRHEARVLTQSEQLLEAGRTAEALGLLREVEATEHTKNLELEALVARGDTARLAALWRLRPTRFVGNEQASVLAARGLLQARDPQAADQLAATWKSQTKHPDWWLVLRVDSLLARRKRSEAKALLEASHFPGSQDASRLLRLALLCDMRSAQGRESAWRYIEKATTCAPDDADVHSFRGEFLEAAGRIEQAEAAYTRAWQAAPRNPAHCSQLAGFYRRQGNLERLTETLTVGMTICPADFLRVSDAFWRHMVTPRPAPKADPPGGAQALARLLNELPAERFFESASFDALPAATAYAERYPEVRYLELAQALQDGSDGHAAALLTQVSRQARWNPALERALAQLLVRYGQELPVPAAPARTRHPYFVALDKPGADPALERLISSRHAIAAAYLAGGWWEAALRLASLKDDLTGFPEWYAYGLAQALRVNRGTDAALRFVTAQRAPSALLQLTRAELLRAVGQPAQARPLLKTLAERTDGVGYRARSLKALDELEQHQPEAAQKTIRTSPELAASETGKALLRAAQQLGARKETS
jgi:tetratricopeptide (TPR) repeat protein